jgi:hypothetical protein
VLLFVRRERLLHYLGNMMTISFGGSLLLLFALLLSSIISSPYFYAAWFMFVVSYMLAEHMRRVSLLQLHWSVSLTWVIYRLIVLAIIL